jgi:hypothetical protein
MHIFSSCSFKGDNRLLFDFPTNITTRASSDSIPNAISNSPRYLHRCLTFRCQIRGKIPTPQHFTAQSFSNIANVSVSEFEGEITKSLGYVSVTYTKVKSYGTNHLNSSSTPFYKVFFTVVFLNKSTAELCRNFASN